LRLTRVRYLNQSSPSALYAFIMVHNHPSGDPFPSEADLRLTRRIVEASKILQLQLIDHVSIGSPAPGRGSYFSFKEGGVIS
jgi:DNA repair protein RadC